MTFLTASLDWFLGSRASHMGPEQYVAHAGMRDGQSTSGAMLWTNADSGISPCADNETDLADSAENMVDAETNLLHVVAAEIGDEVPNGISIVDLGPGTATSFKDKTLPILDRLKSKHCVLVDKSIAFLDQIAASTDLGKDLEIKLVVDDFFENEIAYCEEQALICSFGSTISNIINPVSDIPPQAALVDSLSKMAHAANSGWMLVGFDSDQDGERIKSYYSNHPLFQLNIIDRMAVELPIKGDFDPKAFDYEPEWIAASGQLAHIAVVNRNLNFTLGNTPISLKRGQKLHIKNSYKFTHQFFEHCCKLAGLEVVRAWTDDSPATIYLLKILPRQPVLCPTNNLKSDADPQRPPKTTRLWPPENQPPLR